MYKKFVSINGTYIPIEIVKGIKTYVQNGIRYKVGNKPIFEKLGALSYAKEQANYHSKLYTHLVEIIDNCKKAAVTIEKNIKKSKNDLRQYLSSIGVGSIKEITNVSQQKHANELDDIKLGYIADKRSNNSTIISCGYAAAGEALKGGSFKQQVIIQEHILDQLG